MRTAGPGSSPPAGTFGLDFIAFYTGGTFAREGRGRDLFDLRAVQAFQRDLARRNGVDLGSALGPWWNPPFYAWVFAPLSRLPFGTATRLWIGINLSAIAASVWLLRRMLPADCSWRSWGLIPVLIGLSTPFIHCVTHGQNSGTSLLLLTATVAFWRAGRDLAAGLIGGLLFYKPQLGAVLAAAMVISLGWRAAYGLVVTGSGLLLVTVLTLPGTLGDFLHRMPANVHFVQDQCAYLWERHVTLKAFWRLLLQGQAVGDPIPATRLLTALSAAAVAVALVRVSPLRRWMEPFARPAGDMAGRLAAPHDRLIAATVAATPLVMPFYFDYDLLLLAVPAVLVAAEWMRRAAVGNEAGVTTAAPGCARRAPSVANKSLPPGDRWLLALGAIFYGWLMLNADVAEHTRVNLAVPLLVGVTSLLIARSFRPDAVVAQAALHRPEPALATAA